MISSGFATLAISLVPIASLPAATDPADLPEPSGEQLADAVRVWDPAGVVQTWDPTGSVSEVDEVESGEDTTITLATDILFTSESADLADAAVDRIADLVADVPEAATVEVAGHTDSRTPSDVTNQELSEQRADAVAEVVSEERDDVELEVSGHADSDPAEREDPDDPSTYAANRRVEIIYEGE